MKTLKVIIAALVVVCVFSLGFLVGRDYECKYYGESRSYEVACRMSDLIRCYEDHLHNDSLIEDYGCFEELEGIFLHHDAIGEPINTGDYSWCY